MNIVIKEKIYKICDKIYSANEKNKLNLIFSYICEGLEFFPTVLCNLIQEYCINIFDFEICYENSNIKYIYNNLVKIELRDGTNIGILNLNISEKKYFKIIPLRKGKMIVLHENNYVFLQFIRTYLKLDCGSNKYTVKQAVYSKIIDKDEYIRKNIITKSDVDNYDIFLEDGFYFAWLILVLKNDYITDLFWVIAYLLDNIENTWTGY